MDFFVISVDRECRKDNIKKQEKVLGKPINKIEAYDKQFTDMPSLPFERGYWGCEINDGEKCCYHSHLRALGAFLKTDEDYAVIFEDDFQIIDKDKLEGVLTKLPNNLDHLQLHRMEYVRPWTNVRSEHFNDTFDYCKETTLLQPAYVISRRLAEYVCDKQRVMKIPYDHLHIKISRESGFNYYEVKEGVVSTIDLGSVIHE